MEKPICLITGATEGVGKFSALELAGKGFKPPGLTADLSKVAMRFSYEAAFGKSSANGYERLLLDAMLGDAALFSHRDGVEAAWALFTPILEEWAKEPDLSFPNYPAGA